MTSVTRALNLLPRLPITAQLPKRSPGRQFSSRIDPRFFSSTRLKPQESESKDFTGKTSAEPSYDNNTIFKTASVIASVMPGTESQESPFCDISKSKDVNKFFTTILEKKLKVNNLLIATKFIETNPDFKILPTHLCPIAEEYFENKSNKEMCLKFFNDLITAPLFQETLKELNNEFKCAVNCDDSKDFIAAIEKFRRLLNITLGNAEKLAMDDYPTPLL